MAGITCAQELAGSYPLSSSMSCCFFSVHKLVHLMDKHNPQVVSYVNYNAYTFDDVFNMRDENFKMAFALERYLTGEVLDD